MEPPIRGVLSQFLMRQLQPANEEDKANGAVEDAILRFDDSAMRGNIYSTVSSTPDTTDTCMQ